MGWVGLGGLEGARLSIGRLSACKRGVIALRDWLVRETAALSGGRLEEVTKGITKNAWQNEHRVGVSVKRGKLGYCLLLQSVCLWKVSLQPKDSFPTWLV